MRARTIGAISGLVLAIAIIVLVLGLHHRSPNGAAIDAPSGPGSSTATRTLPANASAPTVVNANFTIDAGRIEPRTLAIRAGALVMLTAYAVTGPAKLIVPDAAVSTPLLSDRQLRSFQFRINVPGNYTILCKPCGVANSFDAVNLTVTRS